VPEKPDPGGSITPLPLPGNADYLEALYEQWRKDPSSVNGQWQVFFQGFDLAMCPRTCTAVDEAKKQSAVASLIYAYRNQGHLIADLDPLGNNLDHHPDLEDVR